MSSATDSLARTIERLVSEISQGSKSVEISTSATGRKRIGIVSTVK